ncbi:MAG: hotdog domain-containing protein [Sneathiella sp.]
MTAPLPFQYQDSMTVEVRHTVSGLPFNWPGFTDMPPVLATAVMIGFAEQTCIRGLRELEGGPIETVGTHINLSHSRPTPVGDTVTAIVDLIEVDRKKLTFRIGIHDSHGQISSGKHERFMIDPMRFMETVGRRTI